MHGVVYTFFSDDHRRLDSLLERATADIRTIDSGLYAQFRAGLLKHIGMEEKLLFPAVQRMENGVPHPTVARLRLDHGAIAALLVPVPSAAIIAALKGIIAHHDLVEEGPGGVYDAVERMPEDAANELLDRLRHMPEVPVLPLSEKPNILDATRRALARAGYSLDEFGR